MGEQLVGELYAACYRRLVAQLYAFTDDLSEAQDVVQEAFTRALARPAGLTGVDNPEAWIRTVAVNVVRRRWRRRRVLDTILLRERPILRLTAAGPEPDNTDLAGALRTLPKAFREVIVLHYLADLAVDEIAQVLEVRSAPSNRACRGVAPHWPPSSMATPQNPLNDQPQPEVSHA
jgi:RNA polymerase sigma-70 factor, ECF subfamily